MINLPRRPGLSYDEQLRRFFKELGSYWRRELLEVSQSTDERVKADLLVPAESSVTCYFEVPLSTVAWYRQIAFPIVEEAGFAPVVASDVQTPPGTDITKGDALALRATVVVDISSEAGMQYAALAALKRDERNVLLLRGSADPVPSILSGLTMLVRNEKSAETFQESFRQWIFGFRDDALASRRTEAERLLEKRDFDGALISAVALLEAELSQRLGHSKTNSIPRSNSITLVSRATEAGILLANEYGRVANAVKARNDAVHRQVAVPMGDATDYVRTILAIVERMPPLEPQSGGAGI